MQNIVIKVEPRSISGKKVRVLRRDNWIPGVVYGHNFDPLNIQVDYKTFEKAYKQAGQSTVVYLNVNDQQYPTIIKDIAVDPVSDDILHADFYKVNLSEKIKASVPLVIFGESPAVKSLGGILIKNLNELEVEVLPQDLPHEIRINIDHLANLNDQILVRDIKLPEGVEAQAKPEDIVVLVQEPLSEQELKAQLEMPAGTAEEVEVITKEKEDESGEESPEITK